MKQLIDSESMSICRYICIGFPGGTGSKETTCQCRKQKRLGLDSWVGKIPRRRKWHPTSVFLPGESPWTVEPGGLWSMGLQRVGQNWVTKNSTQLLKIFYGLIYGLYWRVFYALLKRDIFCCCLVSAAYTKKILDESERGEWKSWLKAQQSEN